MDAKPTDQTPTGAAISTTLPITVYTRPEGQPTAEWQELDQGPGVIHIPTGQLAGVRIKNIDDDKLETLVKELASCEALVWLNLSENRNVTSDGLESLGALTHLTHLNLSSCAITSTGLKHLSALPKLEDLDLSYCNRITDEGLKALKPLTRLSHLNLQGCVKISNGGISRTKRRGLEIHK